MAPAQRQQQRRGQREPVRREDGHDVEREDEGVRGHACLDPASPSPGGIPCLLLELLEREAERAALSERLRAAAEGRGSCVLVRGPAGIGKSALLAEARDQAAAPGCAVLPRAAQSSSAASPSAPSSSCSSATSTACTAPPPTPPPRSRSRRPSPNHAVLHGLYWLAADLAPLARGGRRRALAGPPSLRWLAYMVNRVEELPVALVLAERDRRAGGAAAAGSRCTRRPRVLDAAPLSRTRPRSPSALGREPTRRRRRVRGDAGQPVLRPRAAGRRRRRRAAPR